MPNKFFCKIRDLEINLNILGTFNIRDLPKPLKILLPKGFLLKIYGSPQNTHLTKAKNKTTSIINEKSETPHRIKILLDKLENLNPKKIQQYHRQKIKGDKP